MSHSDSDERRAMERFHKAVHALFSHGYDADDLAEELDRRWREFLGEDDEE